ncbi:MAG: M23 family metallopeptidase [Treponemataceae bacterium]
MRSYAGLHPIDTISPSGDTPPLDLAELFRFETYTVKAGETLSGIAAKQALSIGSIIAANRIRNAKRVHAGTILKIPNMDGLPYTVRNGDNLSRIASSYGIPLEAILDANDLGSADINPGMNLFLPGARMSGSELRQILGDAFVYPLRGILTSTFGWRNDPFTGVRRFHAAIDLAAPLGTPVHASMDGRVSVVGYNSVYGKYIILTHQDGYQTWYAHLNEYRTEKGSSVKQGQRIGDVGNTGYSTGSHVHFAVFKNGRAMNPLSFLPRR